MAQDPYGFPETTSPQGAESASTSMWLGTAAALLCSVGLCMMYIPYFIACPLGIYAAWKGWGVFGGSVPADAKDRAMASVGVLTGIVSACVSGMFAIFIMMYAMFFFLYFAFILVLVGVGAAAEAPPAP